MSPALLTKSCYCGPCLQGLVPGPLPWRLLEPGLSGCLSTAPAKGGALAWGGNEAK